MKTVPTIVASSSAVAASALGLAFARQDSRHDSDFPHAQHLHPRAASRRTHSAPLLDMTSAATCTYSPVDVLSSHNSFTLAAAVPDSPRPLQDSVFTGPSRAQTPNYAEPDLHVSKRSLKRGLSARNSTPMSMDSARSAQEVEQSNETLQTTQGNWFKRLSTFSSNDGSVMSSNRPHSVAISQSNGSVAFSNAGSTTPIFPSFSPTPTPPNKLVKRSSSVRSTKGGSRIPIPTFKKPATSHERDANLQRRPSTAGSAFYADSLYGTTASPLRSYFTPKLALTSPSNASRRASTSIPNPIKRITPDRKYHPILVSGRDNVRPASLDLERPSLDDSAAIATEDGQSKRTSRRFFSNPLPSRPGTASTNTSTSIKRLSKTDQLKRNFSFSKRHSFIFSGENEAAADRPILSPVPLHSPSEHGAAALPKWKRPSKLRLAESRNPHRDTRVVSPSAPATADKDEPPSKRRDFTGPGRSTPSPRPISRSEEHAQHSAVWPGSQSTANDTSESTGFAFDSSNTTPHVSFQARQASGLTEFTSSFAESDSDARYLDDDGFDSPNDTLFDSIRTRATSAGSTGFKGPRIDAIFDHPLDAPGATSTDGAYYSPKLPRDTFERPRHSIIEEEENMPTPQRHVASSHGIFGGASPNGHMPSSPPSVPRILRRKPSFDFTNAMDDEQDTWDFGDTTNSPSWASVSKFPAFEAETDSELVLRESPDMFAASPFKPTAQGLSDGRSNIFDWSEQQPIEKSPAGKSPPRPRTVHGKKDADNRGSRTAGRRAPSGFHTRSQSVPVVPEIDGKRASAATNKFGTWGVGSKGVTEDWNEDFDFEESMSLAPTPTTGVRHASEGMQVPKAIQEQQINVLANIGLLRDWGLLIEELKELRARAQALNLREELNKEPVWHEVDAMIDLADQESNDHTLDPRQSPPSSPTFDDSAFDEPPPALPMRNSPRVISKIRAEDIWDSPGSSPARKMPGTPEQGTPRRPRKDSEAVARSVIEALQQRRNTADVTGSSPAKSNKKVPFDTATLRRIVPYVQELRDKVKRTIREAEGLHDSPRSGSDNETLLERFSEVPESPSVRKGQRRSNAASARDVSEHSLSPSPPEDLSRRLELLTVG